MYPDSFFLSFCPFLDSNANFLFVSDPILLAGYYYVSFAPPRFITNVFFFPYITVPLPHVFYDRFNIRISFLSSSLIFYPLSHPIMLFSNSLPYILLLKICTFIILLPLLNVFVSHDFIFVFLHYMTLFIALSVSTFYLCRTLLPLTLINQGCEINTWRTI